MGSHIAILDMVAKKQWHMQLKGGASLDIDVWYDAATMVLAQGAGRVQYELHTTN